MVGRHYRRRVDPASVRAIRTRLCGMLPSPVRPFLVHGGRAVAVGGGEDGLIRLDRLHFVAVGICAADRRRLVSAHVCGNFVVGHAIGEGRRFGSPPSAALPVAVHRRTLRLARPNDRVRLASERVHEVLRDAVVVVARHVVLVGRVSRSVAVGIRQLPQRHLLHRVVEVVFARHRASQNLASGAVLAPEEAAARVGVRRGRAVGVDRRAKPALVVVEVALLVERHAARRVDAPFAQDAAVGGAALRCGGNGGRLGDIGFLGRLGQDAV